MARVCYQINLQTTFGGGEVFTRFFSEALRAIGWNVVIFVHRSASFWANLAIAGVRIEPVLTEEDIWTRLPERDALVITHTVASADFSRRLSGKHRLLGIIHMPLYDRNPSGLQHYQQLFGVSRHVIASVVGRGYRTIHPEPLYGIADLEPRGMVSKAIRAKSCYDWDRRKLRDRLMSWFEPLVEPLRTRAEFKRNPGVTVGIVSRLTPIKQFPLMFSVLAKVFARHPGISLEVFGSGGYATVRDLRRSLEPARSSVRYWGHQTDVASIYSKLDYVLSGLPEKEAMGLNLIEAQQCGTPVLAVDAPPFVETVVDCETGYLFCDPREDGGRAFDTLLEAIESGSVRRPDPRLAIEHMDRFSRNAFRERVRTAFGTPSG